MGQTKFGAQQIGTDAVGASQLGSTSVVAGTYTNVTATVDADGRITDMSSSPLTGMTTRYWYKNRAQTAFINGGMTALPTVTSNSAAISGDTTNRALLTVDTVASSGSSCGAISTSSVAIRGWQAILSWPIHAGASISNVRIWCGFTSADLTGVSAPTTQHVAAFRYATDVDGTAFWRCVTCDGSSNVTTTTTSIAVATGTEYDLRIELGSSVKFYIDNVLVATHASNLPGNTTGLLIQQAKTTLDASSKNLRMASMALSHK